MFPPYSTNFIKNRLGDLLSHRSVEWVGNSEKSIWGFQISMQIPSPGKRFSHLYPPNNHVNVKCYQLISRLSENLFSLNCGPSYLVPRTFIQFKSQFRFHCKYQVLVNDFLIYIHQTTVSMWNVTNWYLSWPHIILMKFRETVGASCLRAHQFQVVEYTYLFIDPSFSGLLSFVSTVFSNTRISWGHLSSWNFSLLLKQRAS